MAKLMIELDRDEIQRGIPYRLICETKSGSRWNTMRRKREWQKQFTDAERDKCSKLFAQAYQWYLVKGVPDSVVMSPGTLALWQKLGAFCASI